MLPLKKFIALVQKPHTLTTFGWLAHKPAAVTTFRRKDLHFYIYL